MKRRWGPSRTWRHVTGLLICALVPACLATPVTAACAELPWRSPNRYRLLLRVDCRGISRSNSPASVDVDFGKLLSQRDIAGTFDEHTIEVIAYDGAGVPKVFDASRQGYRRQLVPWRLDKLYGVDQVTLSFAVPDETCTNVAVYFDTVESGRGNPRRYDGPVGDGDFFRQQFGRRAIAAGHFDCFCDLDGDGDLDLFQGGVEPFVYCLENVGDNRYVDRGRLTSGGRLLRLPHNRGNGRSWVVPHFFDFDRDGDEDFFPSFMDGPYGSKVALFENTTVPGGPITFADKGPLKTVSGTPVAGKARSGVWFPSLVFVEDFDGDGDRRIDLLLGWKDGCYLHRSLGPDGSHGSGGWRLDDAVELTAGGRPIELFNPCFEAADVDNDGDWDLFGAPQAGQIYFFENVDATTPRTKPSFAAGKVIAYDERYLQRSTHPRVKAADFTGDGLLDLAVDRAWELADLDNLSQQRDYGALLENVGTASAPKWSRTDADHGAAYTETFQPCDALRQNVVRAVDFNRDGRTDLLAGDCDGFVWYFENLTGHLSPVFAEGRRLAAGGKPLCLADNLGHARPDVCDWNNDGRTDLVLADGKGMVTVYLDEATGGQPVLAAGKTVEAEDAAGSLQPIHRGSRSHVTVGDFNNDGKKDLIFSDQENPGFYFFNNLGTDSQPRFAAAESLGLTPYVRPNLGRLVDWDGDGRQDLIACEFEHSIRFYRNVGSSRPGEPPKFADPAGVKIIKPFSIMMISGADVVDLNRDGDLDVITGQGHGGSRIRFYERDYIQDCLSDTRPIVSIDAFGQAGPSLLEVVRRYADAMIEHGRDTYGPQHSGLLLSALDRRAMGLLSIRPAPPGGVRRGDRAGLPWRRLTGANPQVDQNLLRVFYALSEITSDPRYGRVADHQIRWFFQNTQSPVTGLLPWGEHMAWDVRLDRPISSGTELSHEFARPWALWERTFQVAPAAAERFALGLWNHQIADHRTGAFDRHAPYDRHGPRDGKDFPRHGGFYVHTWAHAYQHTKQETFLRAIESVLGRFERKRSAPGGGRMVSTMGPLDVHTAAAMVPGPLAARLRKFAQVEDRLILDQLRGQFGDSHGKLKFEPTWQAGYASGVTADWAMFGWARWQQVRRQEFRDLVVAVADAYVDALPDEDVDVWPMSFAQVISAQVAAYKLTDRSVYLDQARRFARMAVELYFQDSPLPRASLKTDHYETITGADSLALALLEVHAAANNLNTSIPPNTIDR